MLFGRKPEWEGAWEECGVLGTRIEIEGKKLIVLWRGGPVLETTFRAVKKDGVTELVPAHTGMRYQGDSKDYADVVSLTFADGELTFVEHFPITGDSRSVLTKTDYSRYGNCDPTDELFPALKGRWKSTDGFWEIVFDGDEMTLNGDKRRFVVLKSRPPYDNEYRIADPDPTVGMLHGLYPLEYHGDTLVTWLEVCDAPAPKIVFVKVK